MLKLEKQRGNGRNDYPVRAMWNSLVAMVVFEHPSVQSHAAGPCRKDAQKDGRTDTDANYGVKTYHFSDGRKVNKYWYGYQLNLVVDTTYELPVIYSVTQASRSEVKEAEKLVDENPGIFDGCDILAADRGYDSSPFIKHLWTEYKVKAVIDIRKKWGDGDDTRLVDGWSNVVYNLYIVFG